MEDSYAKVQFDYVSQWFASWPSFNYNPKNGHIREWRRLCRALGCDPDNNQDIAVQQLSLDFRTAAQRQLLALQGRSSETLKHMKIGPIADFFAMAPQFDWNPYSDPVHEWRQLCVTLGLDPDDQADEVVRESSLALRSAILRQPIWRPRASVSSAQTVSLEEGYLHNLGQGVIKKIEEQPAHYSYSTQQAPESALALVYSTPALMSVPTAINLAPIPIISAPISLPANPASAPTSPIAPSSTNHIAAYFAKYPQFTFNPNNHVVDEWERLCRSLNLDPDQPWTKRVRKMHAALDTALVRHFNARFGTNANDLSAWQGLCRRVDILVPDTIIGCYQVSKYSIRQSQAATQCVTRL